MLTLVVGLALAWGAGPEAVSDEVSDEVPGEAPIAEESTAPGSAAEASPHSSEWVSPYPYGRFKSGAYYWGWRQGRNEVQLGRPLKPPLVGAGVGLVVGGAGAFLLGPFYGAPILAAGCLGAGAAYRLSAVDVPAEPPWLPPLDDVDALEWRSGFERGYIYGTRKGRAQLAHVGGVVGVVGGVVVGMTASALVLRRWGYWG